MNPARIIVLGDSVTWGQGLLPAHKFAALVAAGMGVPSLGDDAFLAHSGAIIGVNNPSAASGRNGEIPAPAPMIINQVASASEPQSVDLVIITGGINDIGVDTIVNPATDLGPEDEVAAQRGRVCDLQYPSLLELVACEICHHASVGHPNVAGAQAISRAILSTL